MGLDERLRRLERTLPPPPGPGSSPDNPRVVRLMVPSRDGHPPGSPEHIAEYGYVRQMTQADADALNAAGYPTLFVPNFYDDRYPDEVFEAAMAEQATGGGPPNA